MQAVILAAGRGTRMKELTSMVPKPMLKIKGKPILEHKVNALPKKINELVFVVGYRAENIMSHFKHYYGGRRVTYVFQTRSSGTGGALHLAKSILKDKFLVIMGDDLYHPKDINKLLDYDMAILGYEVDDPTQFGVIKTNTKGHMVDVIEKPKSKKYRLVNTGAYVLNRKFFDYDLVPIGKGEYGLPQTLAKMTSKHKIIVHKATHWHPIGNAYDLEKAKELVHIFK